MVFYFTGTGNSLYVAKRLETKPISIPQVIKNEKLNFMARNAGIVSRYNIFFMKSRVGWISQ